MPGKQVVTAPNGERWRVGRRWLDKPPPKPWSRRRRRKKDEGEGGGGFGNWLDAGGGGADDLVAFVVIVLAVAAVVALFTFVIVPLLGLALELALLIALLASGLFGRVVLRHPWTVEAVCLGRAEERVSVQVKGWRASGRAAETLAQTIATTGPPATAALSAPGS